LRVTGHRYLPVYGSFDTTGPREGIAGKVQVSYFTVDFEVAGHRARVTHVAAFNRYDDNFAGGLLGRDFLDGFHVAIDPGAGVVTLTPR
jgi:hypothetical protein